MSEAADRIRVLHVDDEESFAETAGAVLEREDERFEVMTATRVDEGLDRLDAEPIDCVVSDYDMPGRNGIDFLEAVRDEYGDVPFILFTGKGSEEIASEAVSAGVTDYLQKEGGTDQYTVLANRISNAVEAARAQRRAVRHDRINTLLRDVNRRLVEAETVEAIERSVCRTITDSEPYRFAWIGEPDPETMEIIPRASAGDAEAYLDEVTITYDDTPRGNGPAGRAIRTGEVQVAQNIPTDSSFEPWRGVPEKYGYRSVIVLPLEEDGDRHGILVIYADSPGAFDEGERAVLTELSETVCAAIDAAQTTQELEARERELQQSQERYERLVDSFPGGGVFIFDDDLRYVLAGGTGLSNVGLSSADFEGKRPRDIFPKDIAAETEQKYRETLDGEACVYEQSYRGGRYRIRTNPLTGEDGDAPMGVAVSQEITEQWERRRELQRYQRVVETMHDPACIYDEAGRFDVVNEALAELYQTSPETLRGRQSQLIEAIERDADGEPFRELVDGERSELSGEQELEIAKDEFIVAEYRMSRLTIDGEFDGVVAVARDVTERRERERDLRRQNERLEEFASIISHDLRNPLNVAQARLELLEDDSESEHLPPIVRAHDRMEALIEDILLLARTDDSSVETTTVDLISLVEQCWTHVETADAELVTESTLEFEADPSKLQQLLENLIRNAVEHGSTSNRTESGDAVEHGSTGNQTKSDDAVEHGSTDEDASGGETVTITVGVLDDGFFLEDDGPGIPEDEREQVFESGYSTSEGGTGFGLRIVERLAEVHGWEIALTEGRDGGARFEITGV